MTEPVPPGEQLDVADGVARLMGDRALYARIVVRFRADHGDGAAAIGEAIGRGDTRLAHRLAHTLAGAAGMIGARALRQRAGALELALSQGGSAAGALAAVRAALSALLPALDAVQGDPATPGESAAAPPGPASVAALADLLAKGDGAAVDLLETARASLAATLGHARLGAVARAMDEFDFDGALAALKEDGDGAAQAG